MPPGIAALATQHQPKRCQLLDSRAAALPAGQRNRAHTLYRPLFCFVYGPPDVYNTANQARVDTSDSFDSGRKCILSNEKHRVIVYVSL